MSANDETRIRNWLMLILLGAIFWLWVWAFATYKPTQKIKNQTLEFQGK